LWESILRDVVELGLNRDAMELGIKDGLPGLEAIGFGDVIVSRAVRIECPTLLEFPAPMARPFQKLGKLLGLAVGEIIACSRIYLP
jgi:hypothetical protein